VGLLDFQDAVVAHPAYDVVSLMNDARRDVSEETRAAAIRHFLDLTGHPEATFAAAAAALSVQRNLRILGVFARLAGRDGKSGYLRFIPRVWRLLLRDLGHPALAELRDAALRLLPPPEAAVRESA
jgi:aminoglycoside/choline kinase family phosphotransferase